jgi:conjugal transfer mating pair stabilization protein TraG
MDNIATIYSYGGGEVLSLVFNAIAAIFGHNEFKAALYIAALLFGFWVLISSVAKNTAVVPFQWMFWFWIITNCILYPKINVLIYDPITKHEQKVDNVPLILGEFASIVSGLGHGLTKLFETSFSLSNYQRYGQHGSVFASKILKNLGKYRIHDGTLKENMERFIQQCVVLESMMGGKYTVKDLQNSKDIWGLVSTNANPILGFSYRFSSTLQTKAAEGGTEIVTCKAGAKLLEKDLTTHQLEAGSIFGRQLRKIKKVVSGNSENAKNATSNKVFSSFFKTQLASSYQFMSNIALDADKLLKQEMMINSIDDVKNNYAVSKAVIQQRAWL